MESNLHTPLPSRYRAHDPVGSTHGANGKSVIGLFSDPASAYTAPNYCPAGRVNPMTHGTTDGVSSCMVAAHTAMETHILARFLLRPLVVHWLCHPRTGAKRS